MKIERFLMSEYQRTVETYKELLSTIDINRYSKYPSFVTIETLALCNAACDFCPYPTLERKGDKMPEELFDKIINDLKSIPQDHEFSLHLIRINEPLLDSRIFNFYQKVNRNLPNAKISFFTNASLMTEQKIQEILKLQNFEFFVISLNDYRKEEYEQTMQIPFNRTIKHIDILHNFREEEKFDFPVLLSRVGDGTEADQEFVEWCNEKYPMFMTSVSPRTDWMNVVNTDTKNFEVPDIGCRQWFQLHILADGRDAFCCIDAEGQFGFGYNAKSTHLMDIYNCEGKRKLRESLQSRRLVDKCMNCTLLP